jgi:tetratricopeptide (TPR) repeat protein
MQPTSPQAWLESAEALRSRGDEPGALAAYEAAAKAAQSIFDPASEARAMLGVGEMKVLADDSRGARSAFDEAIGRAMEGGLPEVEADSWFALASACFDSGLSKDGHDALLEAMALYRELADAAPEDRDRKARLARAIRLYGEHLGVLGSESDARQALELARIMYEDLGQQEIAAGIREEMERLRDYSR